MTLEYFSLARTKEAALEFQARLVEMFRSHGDSVAELIEDWWKV